MRVPIRLSKDENVSLKRAESEATDSTWETDMATTPGGSTILGKASTPVDDAVVSLHPTADRNGLLIQVQTPQQPKVAVPHVPCDIVLVIDVSGSMGIDAPVPGETGEDFGLSVLDLVKHAARTILETLDERDRLGIVTFASKAKVLQPLTSMTRRHKALADKNIESMQPIDATNLWHGILEGVKLFGSGEATTGRVPAIFVLTDGLPNHMCPAQGYVPKIRSMETLPATLHTFGFGYNLRSGLLKSLAEVGSGNYAFIPDAGMIGTVFVHAMANLQSTFATHANLQLTYRAPLTLTETTGAGVDKVTPVELPDEERGTTRLSITLGNLQYGQSRDIYLRVDGAGADYDVNNPPVVHATLEYSRMQPSVYKDTALANLAQDTSSLPDAEMAFHQSRSALCSFLSSLFPIRDDGEHLAVPELTDEIQAQLDDLISTIPARQHPNDVKCAALLDDIFGAEPKGQISLALSRDDWYRKWGVHYLPSLLNAHARQLCNSFKDAGPLQYGRDSPLFIACRNRLDSAFDGLPAPVPSNTASYQGNIIMAMYNNASGVCFAGSTPVALASGRRVPIRRLRRGMLVQTPKGGRRVVAVLKTPVQREVMCLMGGDGEKSAEDTEAARTGLLVTPWHPVRPTAGKNFVFPATAATSRPARYTGAVYSILLQQDQDADAHAIRVGAEGQPQFWGVTLGHGLTRGSGDVRIHNFFGDYAAVARNLMGLGVRRDGLVMAGGALRKGDLVCGFREHVGMEKL